MSSIERLPGARVVCTVTFPDEQVQKMEKQALLTLGKNMRLPGFRPGKVPLPLLREQINPGNLMEETVRGLLPETLASLLKEHNIHPIIHPKVAMESRSPLQLKITFVERPEVTIKGIDTIKIEKKKPTFDQKDILKMERSLIEQHTTMSPVDRPAGAGDQVVMDFKGQDAEGKEIVGTASKNYRVLLGSKSLIPGFEDALVGAKRGDQKSFTLTFPDTYHAKHLQGKPVTFDVSVVDVQEVKIPEWTDAFAKEHFGVESTADLRKKIEDRMRIEEEMIERQRREQALFEQIRKATNVEIAPELFEEEERSVLAEWEEELKKRGTTVEDWFRNNTKDPVELRADMKKRAEQRIQLRFGLRKFVDEKGTKISDEAMGDVVRSYLENVPTEQRKEAEERLKPGDDLYEQLRWKREVESVLEPYLN